MLATVNPEGQKCINYKIWHINCSDFKGHLFYHLHLGQIKSVANQYLVCMLVEWESAPSHPLPQAAAMSWVSPEFMIGNVNWPAMQNLLIL